ncbi:helix-turn-helix domain-containing protein [uncultured Sphingomonas sp.]|uniref:helix-turn-helix domain-containing protein n=1 Tax=uncultured Sphingomonas sp. TaxID=158754 RepID=UPI0025F897B2|nr:helix-turn-helix domain-containing protein [uncultured Sphingomonas sp.]
MVEADGGTGARVGERLRAAREQQGASLEDVAARTRIPTRHLESLEASDWSRLPATTYSVGFAKSYASAVGLDRNEIGEALRAEMAGYSTKPAASEVFEPADPARVMPRWLVIVAVIGVIAVVAGLLWARQRELTGPDDPPAAAASQAAATGPAPAAAPASSPSGPVVITANEPAWLQVYQQDGTSLFQGELAAGQSYQLPADATAPLLKTGKPEALRISVGTADAPSVGSGTTVRDVSLLPADLMRGGAATPPAPPPAAAP